MSASRIVIETLTGLYRIAIIPFFIEITGVSQRFARALHRSLFKETPSRGCFLGLL